MSLTLSKADKDFIYSKVTLMDFKPVSMERVLVSFLARLRNNGNTSTVIRREGVDLTVPGLVEEYLNNPELFEGFQEHKDVVLGWFEAHLVDIVNRGKKNAALASPDLSTGTSTAFATRSIPRSTGLTSRSTNCWLPQAGKVSWP